jgi:hypothetical protein
MYGKDPASFSLTWSRILFFCPLLRWDIDQSALLLYKNEQHMKRRFRLTGFARFFIVMLFVVPLAYLIASYYNGEDGLANIKRIVGMEETGEIRVTAPEVPEGTEASDLPVATAVTDRLLNLEQENIKLKAQLQDMRVALKEMQADLDRLSAQVNKRRN